MSGSNRVKTVPPKVVITMGVKITNVQFTGEVSGAELINGCVALLRDTHKITGIGYKELYRLIDEVCCAGGTFRKKPTMRASESEATDDTDN